VELMSGASGGGRAAATIGGAGGWLAQMSAAEAELQREMVLAMRTVLLDGDLTKVRMWNVWGSQMLVMLVCGCMCERVCTEAKRLQCE